MKRPAIWLLVLPMLLLSHASLAASYQEKLKETQRQKTQAETLSKELKEEIDGLIEEQQSLKRQLVSLARELESQEQSLLEVKSKQHVAEDELQAALATLESRKGELEAMIQAAVRLSQIPPQAMIMMPDMNGETMQIARTLSIMADTLRQRAKELKEQIEALHVARKKLHKTRRNAEEQLARVTRQRGLLSVKISQRAELTNKLNQQRGDEDSRAAALAKKARNLEQLIAGIEKKQEQKEARLAKEKQKTPVSKAVYVESAIKSSGNKGSIRPFQKMKGKLRAPSAGRIIGHYNSQETSELSKGMTIVTAAGGSVSAPYDAKVAYVGEFRRYGNMVILKHSDNYYTLIAGLGQISAAEGEVLLEGEPLGTMPASGEKKLYVELRNGGDPINPKGWFVGL